MANVEEFAMAGFSLLTFPDSTSLASSILVSILGSLISMYGKPYLSTFAGESNL